MFNLDDKTFVDNNWFSKAVELTFWQKFCLRVLKQGPIPRHVAIIMDGNRRFARTNNIEQIEGHSAGFSRLLKVMSCMCHALGIKELTVYAFSIENFKRPPEEVNSLFNLIRDKFEGFWNQRNELLASGICVRAVGNLLLFPEDLQKAIAKVVSVTKNNDKYFLNVAVSYTSREEMFSSVRKVLDGVREGIIQPQEINEELFNQCLYTRESPELDLLIRTSGEIRLSDFLLWQSTYSTLMFVNCLWPEFSFRELMFTVFSYQNQFQKTQTFKDKRSVKGIKLLTNLKTNLLNDNNNHNNCSIKRAKSAMFNYDDHSSGSQ